MQAWVIRRHCQNATALEAQGMRQRRLVIFHNSVCSFFLRDKPQHLWFLKHHSECHIIVSSHTYPGRDSSWHKKILSYNLAPTSGNLLPLFIMESYGPIVCSISKVLGVMRRVTSPWQIHNKYCCIITELKE